MSKYDLIVIGGGHNGLTAAVVTARKGKRVLVLERRAALGGVAGRQEFHAGFKTNGLLHDTSGVRRKVIQQLQLKRFGLQLKDRRADVTVLGADGTSFSIGADIDASASSIAKLSSSDGKAYRGYREFMRKVSRVINNLMDHPPPEVDVDNLTLANLVVLAKKGMLLKGLGNKTMLELLKVAPMCVADFLNEHFESDVVKAGIAAPAIYGNYAGPWSAYSTINLLTWESAARCQVVGGPGALVDALERAARDAGVEIRVGSAVTRIKLDAEGQVSGVRVGDSEEILAAQVAASCTPQVTFQQLLDQFDLGYELDYWIDKIRSRGTTAKVHLAVQGDVRFNGQSVTFARTGNSINDMEKAFDPVKYGECTDQPFLDIYVPSMDDSSLAPAGHHVVSILAHHVPYDLKGGWTRKAKQKLGENVLGELEKYSPGICDAMVGMEILTPADLAERFSLTNGHIYHGEHFVDQLITRPIPACASYDTPVPGLYLCGSGSHPGGGITCAPGAMAAAAMLKRG